MDALALGLIIGFSIFGCFLLCCSPMLCLTYKVRTDPEGTYKWITKKGREKANWDVKTISVGGYTYSYLESLEPKNDKYLPLAQRELIVMIHGFSSNKDAWNQMAAHLAHRYHLLAIDLVGHGETHPLEADDYKMATQAERLHSVIQAIIGEKKMFHITGTSMGGHVAGVYAAKFPQQVISLCLLCCAGVQGENKAKLVRVYEETGRNYLLPTNLNEFMDMMREVFFKPPPIPKSIANYLWQLRQSRADTYHKIMQDMIVEGHLLQTLLPTIKVPVQVQWGDMDYILDISAVDVIKKHLLSPPDVVIFKNCGHGLQLEFHKQSMFEYQRWLKTLSPRSIQIETVKELRNEKTSLMAAAIPTTIPGALDTRIDVTV